MRTTSSRLNDRAGGHTGVTAVYAVRVTDADTGVDHLVDDGRYTVAKLLGRGPAGLCGARVCPASLLRPHGPVCDDCARAQAARRLTPLETPDRAG